MSGVTRGGRRARSWSAAAYRVLIRLRYPAALRERFGAEMVSLFAAVLAEELERGTVRGLAAAWRRVAWELVRGDAPFASRADGRNARRRAGWTGGVRDDVRHALRSLRREPRFAALVVAVPAIGIALTVTVFAVVNGYLLRPLPYPEPDRLVNVRNAGAAELSWDELDAVFEVGVSWDLDAFSLIGDDRPELVLGAWVTPTFLDAYGVRPALGRRFLADEGRAGTAPVALISDRLWRTRFGADPGIVGRSFLAYMSDRPDAPESFTIVGVLPADFWYFNAYTDVLAPIVEPRPVYTARLREGVTAAQASAALTALARRRVPGLPDDFAVEVAPSREQYVSAVRSPLLVMQAAVLLVLLIACANTAVLLLVRAAGRERELGVRRALGAPASRLARQLVSEGLVLAVLASAAGLLLAWVGLAGVAELVEARIGRDVPGGPGGLRIDATVLAATALLAGGIGVVFGLVPLLTSGRGPLSAVLGEIGRGGTDTRRRQRLRGAMVAAEVALSLALLTGAGLMVRSAIHLQRENLGFSPERLVRAEVGLRQASYPEIADRVAFYDRLLDGVRALPASDAAALATPVPFSSIFSGRAVAGEMPGTDTAVRTEAVAFVIGEGFFDAMGARIVRGRDFSREDVAGSEPVAIVSEALAARLWPNDDPVGRRIRRVPDPHDGAFADEPGPWLRIIGVAADVRRGLGGPPPGDLYTSFRQTGNFWMSLLVRATPGTRPATLLGDIEALLRPLDPDVPLSATGMLGDAVRDAMAPTRFLATLLAGFSAFALLLAVLGLYGVVSYAARQRRRDVAIRMALGADRSEVAALFLRQGLVVVLAGVAAGTGGGYLLGRALAGQLHGVSPGDPATHASLALLLLVTAAAAVWIPARRAAAAEPMRVLREE